VLTADRYFTIQSFVTFNTQHSVNRPQTNINKHTSVYGQNTLHTSDYFTLQHANLVHQLRLNITVQYTYITEQALNQINK